MVVIFDEDTPAEAIAALKPDLLIKGADYAIEEVIGAETVHAANGRVLLVPLVKGQSTTALIRRAAELLHEQFSARDSLGKQGCTSEASSD
jgi:D-beta-D-heptose 7-phosphate kinase/D-beta-D-heptose 1-phosphate adenosyltransferase